MSSLSKTKNSLDSLSFDVVFPSPAVVNPCVALIFVVHSAAGFGGGEGCQGGGGGREFMDIIALMVASQHGHEASVRLLLEWGSDVNFSQKTTGWGPLMAATLSGKVGPVDGWTFG